MEKVENILGMFEIATTSGASVWEDEAQLKELCKLVETKLSRTDLPLLKRNVVHLTDSGPE